MDVAYKKKLADIALNAAKSAGARLARMETSTKSTRQPEDDTTTKYPTI